jgi:hypothetical protein
MARITDGHRRVGLPRVAVHQGDTVPEVPAHWDTLAASCRCLPCAMPADEALVDQTSK